VEHAVKVSNEWYVNYLTRQAASAAARRSPVDRAAGEAQGSKSQSASGNEPVGKEEGKATHTSRCFVCIKSIRKRLIDPRANLYGGSKYIEDALQYSSLIHDDSEKFSEGTVTQEKAGKDEEEMTIIRVWKLD
jgi:hypothetical protein